MGMNPVDNALPTTNQQLVDANKSARSSLFDQFGNPLTYQNKTIPSVPISGVPSMDLDRDSILRIPRVGEFSTTATTSAITLWCSNLTLQSYWTQVKTVGMHDSIGAGNVLIYNDLSSTSAGASDLWTSQRQFQKYARNPLVVQHPAQITGLQPNNHTVVEFGFGAPTSGTTPIVPDGAFFRWTANAVLLGVASYGGVEAVQTLATSGAFSGSKFYTYSVIVDDDRVRFVVCDSSGVPIVDSALAIPTAAPYVFSVSHVPIFRRVYVDAVGGGSAVTLTTPGQVNVRMLDGMFSMSFAEQQALCMQSSQIRQFSSGGTDNPQGNGSFSDAGTPLVSFTPSNVASGQFGLGGEAATALTAASENPLAIFTFAPDSHTTFMLTGISFQLPFVTTAISVNAVPILEWMVVINGVSPGVGIAGGPKMIIPLGISFAYASITQAAGTYLTTEGPLQWFPKVPIPCLPSFVFTIAYKVLNATVITTPGVTRHAVYVDGYFL